MKMDAWHLPWSRETVPHALLDIIRGCNIRCDACYNTLPASVKPLTEIEAELKLLLSRRRLGSVSLVGGEVLLHPRLCEIIRLIKGHGLCAQIFTNAVLLDDQRLSDLKRAGLDMIFVHIDGGQTRPELAPHPSSAQLRELWEEKTSRIARHGIDAGLTMTAFEGELPAVREMVEFMVDSPHVNYLLVTLYRDVENIELHGNLDSGMRGALRESRRPRTDTLTNWQIIQFLRQELGFRPFAFLGSNKDAEDPRWLSYLVATCRDRDGAVTRHSLKASAFEKMVCAILLRWEGKYPMYRPQSTFQLAVQLIMNGLMGGDVAGNLSFALRSCRPGARFGTKRLLFQCPAQIDEDGTLTHCRNCPDAVVKRGELVPVCISDRVS
jgi:pyruvate-formate lyase-activating enzyme